LQPCTCCTCGGRRSWRRRTCRCMLTAGRSDGTVPWSRSAGCRRMRSRACSRAGESLALGPRTPDPCVRRRTPGVRS
jgi:hypothetical protein